MNENLNTMNELSVENQEFYDRALLERELPELLFYEDGDKKVIPTGKGTSIEFRKWNSLEIPEESLTEGVTPKGSKLNITKITATAKQEGDFVSLTDVLNMQSKDPVITETSEVCGEQAGQTIDIRVRDIVSSGTNVQYPNNKVGRDNLTNDDVLTGKMLRVAKALLGHANIKPFEDGTYHAIINELQAFDLKNDVSENNFTDVMKYAAPDKILSGEIGKYDGIRIRTSSNVKTVENASGVKISQAVVYGRHAYAVVNVEKGKGKAKIIVKPLGSSGSSDPLNQRSTVGWKTFFTAVRLNELAIMRIETATTLAPEL